MIDERNDERTRLPEREREKPFILYLIFFYFILRRHVQQDGENSGEAVSTARVMDQGR